MGHFLVLQRLPPLAMPAVSVAIAGQLAGVCLRIRLFRTLVGSIDLRALELLHTTRIYDI
jgi:hypothetical protein